MSRTNIPICVIADWKDNDWYCCGRTRTGRALPVFRAPPTNGGEKSRRVGRRPLLRAPTDKSLVPQPGRNMKLTLTNQKQCPVIDWPGWVRMIPYTTVVEVKSFIWYGIKRLFAFSWFILLRVRTIHKDKSEKVFRGSKSYNVRGLQGILRRAGRGPRQILGTAFHMRILQENTWR